MQVLGFIGLGNMGSGMAKNLVAAGYKVVGFDIEEEKLASVESSGVVVAKSVSEIAGQCRTVILCLPNPDVSRDTIFNELLTESSSATTIIETSTLSPEIVSEFAQKLSAKNIAFLSAPMVGGKNHAANGTIDFLIEGSEEVYKINKSIFSTMGSKARFMGPVPSATLAKLTFNLCRYANLAVAVEAYKLLSAYGANKKAIHDFMSEQSLDNFGQVWAEDMKDMMTKDVPYKPSQVPKKDLALLIEMASSHEISNELVEAIRNTYISME